MIRVLAVGLCVLFASPAASDADVEKESNAASVLATCAADESDVGLELIAPSESKQCCKICRKGKACGDTCIARDKVCRKGPGCACDG